MNYPNHNTESRKNKHLNFKERMTIEIRLADGCSAYKIAKELQRPINTIINEIRRGTTTQIKQGKHVEMYLADTGESVTEAFNYLKDVYGTQFSKVFKSITGIMVLNLQTYPHLKITLKLRSITHILIHHLKKAQMSVIMG